MENQKKTAADVLIDRFLKDVEELGTMPWQRPYQVYNAFNWVTRQPYRGFNRLILPFGEYLTRNQINQINKEKGEDYKFQTGIKWFPICFFKADTKQSSESEVISIVENSNGSINMPDLSQPGFLFVAGYWKYFVSENDLKIYKTRNVLQYYEVAERKYFVNSKGEMLPSRIETGELSLTFSDANEVISSYIDREGIFLNTEYNGIPCYVPSLDAVQLNPNHRNESSWYSTAFHELAHSTGHPNRLDRVAIRKVGSVSVSDKAAEECIAEICAALLCSECKIYDFVTSETSEYENNLAYVASWKKRIKDFGKEFIYIVSQAEKAFCYILGEES